MIGIVTRFIKDKSNAFIAFSLGIIAFLEMYISLFPSIKATSAQLDQLLATYPDAFFKAFGMDKADLAFQNVESYLATEQFSFMWPILAIIFASSLANAIAVNDSDKGTYEFVLAQPVSRTKLFLTRYFSGLLMLTAFTAISIFGAFPLFKLHNVSYHPERFVSIFFVALGFIVAVYSIAAFFSALFSDKGKAGFMAGGVLILMYVLNILSQLKDNLGKLKYSSLFYYFSPAQVLNKNIIIDWALPVFAGFAIVMTTLAVIVYNKRDFS